MNVNNSKNRKKLSGLPEHFENKIKKIGPFFKGVMALANMDVIGQKHVFFVKKSIKS